MPFHNIKLKGREDLAEATMAFHFEKPSGFQFRAGQFCNFTLLDPSETDAEGNVRTFSIASAPFEPDLIAATRMRDSAFKRVLKKVTPGTELKLEGPFGSFTLHNDASRPAVFLIGGIGVTPVRSILLEAAATPKAHRLLLFYSNRRPEDAAFLSELQELEKKNTNYKLVATMTNMEKSRRPWQGETGHISKQMLNRYVPDLGQPIYYSAGPPALVAAMRELLLGLGVNEDNIRTEDFAGY